MVRKDGIPEISITDGYYSAGVTSANRLKTDVLLSSEITLATQIYGWNNPLNQWVKINAEEYPPSSGEYWIGVFGEVGTRTKAENPINESIRKILATRNLIVFYDTDVPAGKIWYILAADVADDLASEFNIWQGYQRDRVELFSGNGTNKNFSTTYSILDNPSYVLVKVGGVTKTWDSDYIITVSDDGKTATIVFGIAPASGTNNVEVTYDAVQRKCAAFIQTSSSYTHVFQAPLKLTAAQFIVASVSNKSANAATVCVNLSGFFEDA